MATKASIDREKKLERKVMRDFAKREKLKEKFKQLCKRLDDPDENYEVVFSDIEELRFEMDRLDRNSSSKRLRRRCQITGRPRGVYRRFGLCRNMLRKFAMMGLVPGVRKASW